MSRSSSSDDSAPYYLARRDQLLSREVEACEDPVCCCEPEPRWLRFQDQCEDEARISEWEVLDRAPSEEL